MIRRWHQLMTIGDNKATSIHLQAMMKKRDFASVWQTMKQYRVQVGQPDTVLYTQMMQTAAMENKAEVALDIQREMNQNNVPLNSRAYQALLQALSNRPDYADRVFDLVDRMRLENIEVNKYHSINILGAYTQLGMLDKAKLYYNQCDKTKQHYKKLMWGYYFHLSQQKDLAWAPESISMDTLSASLDTPTLVSEMNALYKQYGCNDPFIKALCLFDPQVAIDHLDEMTSTRLLDLLKSCTAKQQLHLGCSLYQTHAVHINRAVIIQYIDLLATMCQYEPAISLFMELNKPRYSEFHFLLHHVRHSNDLVQMVKDRLTHPMDRHRLAKWSTVVHKNAL